MRNNQHTMLRSIFLAACIFFSSIFAHAQVIISQYYEGGGTNKWIELTNLGNTAVNTASPQLKLALWAVSGSTGNIVFSGNATNTYNLTVTIPAKGSVLIGNTGNGTEVPYLTAASANETSNGVINFNGNDGVALLDASGNIIDKFGEGINAADVSYVRSTSVTAPSASFVLSDWVSASLVTVQNAGSTVPERLGYHLPPLCAVPAAQPTALNFTSVTHNTISGSFTASVADGFLIVQSTNSTLSANPQDATSYTAGNSLGGGTVISSGTATTFNATGLNANTTYYYYVFAYNNNNCSSGPKYLTTAPLTASQTTLYPPCTAPANSATGISFSSVTSTSMTVGFTAAGGADAYLVVRSTNSSLGSNPQDGSIYVSGSTIGSGTVISAGTATSINQTGLTAATTYYYFVFSYNNLNCSAGPAYKTTSPLTGNKATDPATLNYYFGNLHSHSSHSDGNADNTSKTPADDYAFAKNALCMDFLGISDHNHAGAGMHLSDWQPGRSQAAAASTSNFVALYGQEWGVIGTQGPNGDKAGHVLVYGLDSLAGWENNNYQIYIPKSVYLGTGGLFDIINRHGNNAFASLAHPDNYDYNNILNISYDAAADDAIAATAIASGPAFSTDTTYSSAASISYFAFYRNMLAKGYKLGPSIDHDNHNMTFGKVSKTRLAIMATSLSEANILDAVRKMRFYATEDCAAKVNFTINTQPMGSVITRAGAPVIAVTTITTNSVSTIKLMYGVPGSGTQATTLNTVTNSGSLNYTHTALANLATGYYFLDITESNGNRIITSPIWYTRNDAAQRPMFTTAFFAINETNKVVLKWTASNEPDGISYELQRSINQRDFVTLTQQQGKATSETEQNYSYADMNPINGLAYYRLVRKEASGKIVYSELKIVDRSGGKPSWFVAYPNPVNDKLYVKLTSAVTEKSNIELFDITGRSVQKIPVLLTAGQQDVLINTSSFTKGTYIIKVIINGQPFTQMLNKQ